MALSPRKTGNPALDPDVPFVSQSGTQPNVP
jgi:hypothetical protein